MKTTIHTLCALMIAAAATAQSNAASDIFSDYDHRENVTRISVSGNMFKMMGQSNEKDTDNEFSALADQITGLNVIVDSEDADALGTMARASKKLSAAYEPMMSIRDKNDRMEMFISEKGGIAESLVIAAAHEQNFVIVSITGRIKMDDVSKMSSTVMNTVQGGKFHGEKVDRSDFKLFPNPVKRGEKCTLAIPDDMLGARLTIHNPSGKTVHNEFVNQIEKPLNLTLLKPGTYVVHLQKDKIEVTKKLVIQ